MLWEVEVVPIGPDAEQNRVQAEFAFLTGHSLSAATLLGTARGFLLEGNIDLAQATLLMNELLIDSLVESACCGPIPFTPEMTPGALEWTVMVKAGVMDPAAQSVMEAARHFGMALDSVRTFRRYIFPPEGVSENEEGPLRRVLANDAIEQIIVGFLKLEHLTSGSAYSFQLIRVPLRSLDDASLMRLSKQGQLALNLAEMKTIQAHFQTLGRDPTDIELETLAQTWSEHCSHKTLKGQIDFRDLSPRPGGRGQGEGDVRRIDNLLKQTIFGATQEIRKKLGQDDWCVSVFEDNAGVVRFDERFNVCFKVETHNHPSAIEPYGGANTGLGGVIRDPLGTGLGAKPICNTDVFCFAPPDTPAETLPGGVLHPRKVMKGVVAGVRDYGNRMGIPTVNGAVCFDRRYLGNPLVFCGTVGLIPVDRCQKQALPGDLIVAVGGRTGRDGIHGATFSSIELTSESEKVSGGAVQIGNAITEKKMLDVILQARDRNLYHAITDCGAGGFSSAVGEMGEKLGAVVHLDRAPLKYAGLSYTEIWISEAQERMVLAVPPENWDALQKLCASEDVEATIIGTFEPTGKLRLLYQEQQVGELDMHFLHDGRPPLVRQAEWAPASLALRAGSSSSTVKLDFNKVLLDILGAWNVCSKEWIIRQYDHEVQGGSVLKPLVGVRDDGPGDAAVVMPVLGSTAGLAIGCGINPHYGDLDPYAMAALAIDEAVRNVVAVGANPRRIALLDNFCWGNTDRPAVLGSLVRAAQACRDVALAYTMPFISGKDSLNNEFHAPGEQNLHITIPPTLLISALGKVDDVRRCISMDLKEPGNLLLLLGQTRAELGGSHFHLVTGQEGGTVPQTDLTLAPRIFAKLHELMQKGLVRSCHDLSEGGLAVAAAEMAFAGGLGADLKLTGPAADEVQLFSESPTRFLLEIKSPALATVTELLSKDVPWQQLGQTVKEPRLRVAGASGEWVVWVDLAQLKETWQKPLRW